MSLERICFVSLSAYNYFNPDAPVTGGGAQRQLSMLAHELSDELDVHFIVGDYDQPQREVFDGVVLHSAYTPIPDAGVTEQFPKLIALRQAMVRADADVYIHRGHPRQAAVVYGLSWSLGRQWVYNVSNDANLGRRYEDLDGLRKRLFARGLGNARMIIAQTERQQRKLRERFEADSTVVPNGYPPADDRLSHDERKWFLWVGRIDADQKRPHLYLDLAAELPSEQFCLIGTRDNDDAYYEKIHERAAQLHNVTFVGRVPPEKIHDYYHRAKGLINTSVYEGFPNTFLEAARYGTPIASLQIDSGRFFDGAEYAQGSFERLVDLTERLTHSPVCERKGRQLRESFESQYDVTTVARQYKEALTAGARYP